MWHVSYGSTSPHINAFINPVLEVCDFLMATTVQEPHSANIKTAHAQLPRSFCESHELHINLVQELCDILIATTVREPHSANIKTAHAQLPRSFCESHELHAATHSFQREKCQVSCMQCENANERRKETVHC